MEARGDFLLAFCVALNVVISKGALLVLWPLLWGWSKGGPGGAQGSHFSNSSAAGGPHSPSRGAPDQPGAVLQVRTFPREGSVSALCPFVGLEVTLCLLSLCAQHSEHSYV